jgi:hypothetical protein
MVRHCLACGKVPSAKNEGRHWRIHKVDATYAGDKWIWMPSKVDKFPLSAIHKFPPKAVWSKWELKNMDWLNDVARRQEKNKSKTDKSSDHSSKDD